MTALRRRAFLTGAAGAGILGGTALLLSKYLKPSAAGRSPKGPTGHGGGKRLVPSTCWQCSTRCAILGRVEEGRLVKIKGNPASQASRGRICAKGQAGLNQVYNPDRVLTPLLRTGERGQGKWRNITWDEALRLLIEGGEVAGRKVRGIRSLRDAGTPERFLFHYGRLAGSDRTILLNYVLPLIGTGSIGNHDSICMAAGGVAEELTGGNLGFRDYSKAAFILNFGNGVLEAGNNHVPEVQRVVEALSRGTRMVTFDPRLSNTAAKSSEWIPLKPGTDLAVALAMSHAILKAGLHDRAFIETRTNVTVAELEAHLAPYTPEWAESVSGVPAEKLTEVAIAFATRKPAICLSARGAFMHHNGVQAQRAIFLLQAVAGCANPTPKWHDTQWVSPFPAPPPAKRSLPIFNGRPGQYSHPLAGASHQILSMIDAGPDRPEIYMVYCHNPVFSNGDCAANRRILADPGKVPFLVAVDVGLSETSELADLVLPDATYLERWTCDGKATPDGFGEYRLRQPMHEPLGEACHFPNVACKIASRLGLEPGFKTAEAFVRAACEATPGVREAGGFEFMKAHGVWCDPAPPEPDPSLPPAQIRSAALEKAGFPGLPSWTQAPGHASMAEDQLILVTYKAPMQTQSRTQNCKWLTEIYHENFAWIHPETAARRGLASGDRARIRSEAGEIEIRIRVTEGVHPQAVAISHHCGHWAQGEYASGKRSPIHRAEPDGNLRWWDGRGSHVNFLIPTLGDPIAGAMCWNDTLVRVTRAANGTA